MPAAGQGRHFSRRPRKSGAWLSQRSGSRSPGTNGFVCGSNLAYWPSMHIWRIGQFLSV